MSVPSLGRAWWRVVALVVIVGGGGCRKARDEPPPATRAPDLARALSFRADIAPTLDLHCSACHGARPNPSVELDLRPAAAWKQLVNHDAETRPGARLVVPGDAAKSFLVDKMTGALGPHEGKAMPLDATTGQPMRPSPLTAFVETKLLPWIDAGAKDD